MSKDVANQPTHAWHKAKRWQFRLRTLLVGITAVAMLLGLGIAALPWIERAGMRVHQESVTRELGEWGAKYSQIQNDRDAFQAIDMLRYMQHYYIPSEGYRSDSSTEMALQTSRQKAITTIIDALEHYTGEHLGSDLDRWETWRNQRESQIQAAGENRP